MKSSANIIFTFIFTSFFLLQLYLLLNTKLTFFSDDAIYASLARLITERNFDLALHPFWMPLYPLFSALAYLFFGQWELSLRLISVIASVSLLYPVYLLAKKVVSPEVGIFLSLSIALNYPLIKIGIFPQADALAAFFMLSSFCVLAISLSQEKLKIKNLLVLSSALLLGLEYLTRPEGTLFFAIFLSFLILNLLIQIFLFKKYPLREFLIIPSFILIFFITISPYLIPIHQKLGFWTLSQKFNAQIQQEHAFKYKFNTTWNQETTSVKNPNYKSIYFLNPLSYILDNFNRLNIWFIQKIHSWIKIYLGIFPIWSIPLILLGTGSLLRKKSSWQTAFILYTLFIALPVTFYSTAISDIRYLAWSIPLIYFMYYLGADLITTLIKTKLFKSLVVFFFFTLTFLFPSNFFVNLWQLDKFIANYNQIYYLPEIQDLAIRLSAMKTRPTVMSRYEALEFYSNGKTIYLPQTDIETLINYAKTNNVDFLIAWQREIGSEKNLSLLLENNFTHPRLKLIYSLNSKDGPLKVYTLLQ